MRVTITFEELQQRLPDLLSRAAQGDEEFIIERDGQAWVVILGARQWRSQPDEAAASSPAGPLSQGEQLAASARQLDNLGVEYRFSEGKQVRAEDLLARDGRLTAAERRELDELLREADEILLRRAEALNQTG